MNVVQTEKVFPPPGERNGPRLREQFAVPSRTINQFRLGVDQRRRTNWKSTSSSFSRSPRNRRGTGRGRASISTSCMPTSSHKYISRSGTKTTGGTTSSMIESGGIILAMTTGRGEARAEVGMAVLDIRCPHLILCQISDSQIYTNALSKLYLYDPIEVLMPDTMCDRAANRNILYRFIRDKFPELQVTAISRVHFNDTVGLERVKTLCIAEYSSVELFVKEKYYALAAASALLKYVEYAQRIVYTPKSMRIEFQGSQNSTTLDLESARSLELVQSQCGKRNVSLLGILDNCSTPMGRKLLRANILQPPCNEHIILERQASIAELVANRSLQVLLQPIVRQLYGADRLLALSTAPVPQENNVQCAEQNLNYLLLLKNLMEVVPELEAALSSAESDILRRIGKKLENPQFRMMKERILETIHPDARAVSGYTSSNMQRCFAIKAGINDLLDVARQTYCELIDDLKSMVENLASKYKLPLSLGCNVSLGYHIQAILPRTLNAETFNLPTEFIEVRKNKRVYTMTTTMLSTLSQQCRIASEELHVMSNVILCDLLQCLRGYIDCLFHLSADVAELDLMISLAKVSSVQTYVMPTFGPKLELIDSRHPILEVFGIDAPIPNNVNASTPWNFHVISGPNMSGKSTYLKQIVLLHIMSQIGCFVPAKKAAFRITDLIFCKIAIRDDIEYNASTFSLEMKEAQYILRTVTPTSLIVLDELCKSTAMEEGASIAWAICERLLNTSAFVFAATHFAYLTKLANLYYNATNHYFETITLRETTETDNCCRLTYTHRLKLGVATTGDYGIVLAESSGLPKSVTEAARQFASERLIVDRITIESNTWEHKCYNIVGEMYELLEMDKFNRAEVAKLLEQIAKLQWQEKDEGSVENDLTTKISDIVVERRNEDDKNQDDANKNDENKDAKEGEGSNDPIPVPIPIPIPMTVVSRQSFDEPKKTTLDETIILADNNFPASSLSSASIAYTNASLVFHNMQNKSLDFQNVPLSFRRNEQNASRSFAFNSINPLFPTSIATKHTSASNSLEKSPSTSNSLKFQFSKRCSNGPHSFSFTTNHSVPSFSLTRESGTMCMSMSTDASLHKSAYEYCLSDDDLIPPDMSQISIPSNIETSSNNSLGRKGNKST